MPHKLYIASISIASPVFSLWSFKIYNSFLLSQSNHEFHPQNLDFALLIMSLSRFIWNLMSPLSSVFYPCNYTKYFNYWVYFTLQLICGLQERICLDIQWCLPNLWIWKLMSLWEKEVSNWFWKIWLRSHHRKAILGPNCLLMVSNYIY